MKNIIEKIIKQYINESLTDKIVKCEDIIYTDTKKYGTKGWTQKSLMKNNDYFGPIMKNKTQIDQMCNCCDDGSYVRDIKCEDAFIDHLLLVASDKTSLDSFMWLKPNCQSIKKPNTKNNRVTTTSRLTDTSLTIIDDDLSYNFDMGEKETKNNFIFSLFGNIIQESFDILKPHNYKFKMSEFVSFDNEEKGFKYFLSHPFEEMGKKIMGLTNFLEWEISLEIEQFNIKFVDNNNGVAYIAANFILTNSKGKELVNIKLSGEANANIQLSGSKFVSCKVETFNLTGEAKSFLNFDINVDESGIIHLIKGKYIDIPIDISQYLKLYYDFELPVPDYIPFNVEIPDNEKTLYAIVEAPKLSIGDISSTVSGNLNFSNSKPASGSLNTFSEPTNNKKQEKSEIKDSYNIKSRKFSDKIMSILNESDNNVGVDTTASLIVFYSVVQNLINHIGGITFSHKFSDFISDDQINDKLKTVWGKIKNNDIFLTIGNSEVKNVSNSEMSMNGVITLKTNRLFAKKYSNEKTGEYSYDIDADFEGNGYVRQNIPYSAKIYITNNGNKINMGISQIVLNVHKFLKINVNENNEELDTEFSFGGKDSTLKYPTGVISPLKFDFDIPTLESKKVDLVIGTLNKKTVNIVPSNSYEINLTEESINSTTDVNVNVS